MEYHKVVIVGAGVAGLHAAFKLGEIGIRDVVILEALDRIGGRIHTIPVNGDVVELGAQWIHGQGENPLWKFVQENQIPISPVANRDGEGVFVRDDGAEIPKDILDETELFLDEVHDRCYKYNGMDPKLTPESVGHYFEQEFEEWLRTEKSDDDPETRRWRRQFFTWWIKWEECDSGCDDLYKHSVISWCDYIDHEPDTTFAFGFRSLLDIYRKFIEKSQTKVVLNQVVDRIDWMSNNNDRVVVKCSNGQKFETDCVIFTASLGYLKKHHFDLFHPALPSKNVAAIESIDFGTIDKIMLEFEQPFWKHDNPGFMFLWSGDENNLRGSTKGSDWIRSVMGFDGVLNQPNMLVGWISGQPARYMERLSDKEISDAILAHLATVVRKLRNDPNFTLPELKRIIVTRWDSDPFFRGVYSYRNHQSDLNGITNVELSYPLTDASGNLRVLFAGEATEGSYYGTVHGAMISAEREVNRLQAESTSIT